MQGRTNARAGFGRALRQPATDALDDTHQALQFSKSTSLEIHQSEQRLRDYRIGPARTLGLSTGSRSARSHVRQEEQLS